MKVRSKKEEGRRKEKGSGNARRELTFRKLMVRLRARKSLDAEEIQELADALSRLWREREMLYNNRISRARKMLDSMLDGEKPQVISTGDITSSENYEVISTGDITTPETVATEKGEKKSPPLYPPIRKDPKRNPPPACSRVREEEFADRLFLEFWAKYPKECPRKVGKKKCRAKYALLMRNAKDSTALHAAILAGIERWRRSQDWVEDDGRFIKAPLVWLNQENWNDDPAPYAPRRTKAELEAESIAARKEASRRAAIAALTAKDWALCADRCANCCGDGCSKDIEVPPDHRINARRCSPEECPRFAAKEGGAA